MAFATFRFGDFELRPDARQLLQRGLPVKLGARAFDVLLALAERRERLVSKDELMNLVWPHVVVEENNLQVQISALRRLLGTQVIATVPGHGYRFIATLAGDAAAAAPPAAATAPPLQPAFETEPMVGREVELPLLVELVVQHRLVTLLGAGGIGKTRLARAGRALLAPDFADGVAWVDLLPCHDPAQLLAALAQATATALPEGAGLATLAQVLSTRRMLVVLDNCEHVLVPAAECAQALLTGAPGVHVLVTSQARLQLASEHVMRLAELSLPPEDASLPQLQASAAVALFLRRARAGDAQFPIDDHTLRLAGALCRALDGNALAIELAAARAPQIGMSALAERLGERLRLLRSADRDRPTRQQSLQATMAWSFGLLDEADRRALCALAVCAGSFALPVAHALAQIDGDGDGEVDEWAALDALVRLVERSLVRVEQLEPPRYRLLESPRLFALEQLRASGAEAAARQRHGRALAALALAARDDVHALTQQQFIDRYGGDTANLQAAHERAAALGDAAIAAATGELLSALEAARSGISLRRARMQAAGALLPAAGDALTRALLCNQIAPASSIAWPGLPRLDAARQRLLAWQAAGDTRECYLAAIDLAAEHARAGEADLARRTAAEALAGEDPDWPPGLRIAGAMLPADLALYGAEAPAVARTALQRALRLAEAIHDDRRLLRVRFRLAEAATAAGHWDEARAEGEAVVALMERQNRPLTLGMALANLCAAMLLSGDADAARPRAAAALKLLQPFYVGVLCHHLALLAQHRGAAGDAAWLLGHADAWYAGNQSPLRQAVEQRLLEATWPMVEAALGAEAAAAQRARGRDAGPAEVLLLAQRILG